MHLNRLQLTGSFNTEATNLVWVGPYPCAVIMHLSGPNLVNPSARMWGLPGGIHVYVRLVVAEVQQVGCDACEHRVHAADM